MSRSALLVAVLLTACASTAPAEEIATTASLPNPAIPTVSSSPSPLPTSPASPTAPPSVRAPSPTATATPLPPPELAVGRVGVVTATDLQLRSAPGLNSDVAGDARWGWHGLVEEGPVEEDGLIWYRVTLSPSAEAPWGCEPELGTCIAFRNEGWLAAGPPANPAWFVPIACPPVPTDIDELSGVDFSLRSSCFGEAQIRLEGYLEVPDWCSDEGPAIEPLWLGQTCWLLSSREVPGLGIWIHFRQPPAHGGPVDVTGHFDDDASLSCAARDPDGPKPEQAVRGCRNSFVVDSWEYAE